MTDDRDDDEPRTEPSWFVEAMKDKRRPRPVLQLFPTTDDPPDAA